MFKSFKRLIVTISYLKFIQIYFRIYYFFRKKFRNTFNIHYPLSLKSNCTHVVLKNSIVPLSSFDNGAFDFLNVKHSFADKIDWNYDAYGKLWTYNLTYFEYLNQENIKKEDGIELIYNFINYLPFVRDGLEPFPISLRGMNWIKFLSNYNIIDKKIDDSLYAQYCILMDNIEYHLLGNHLLENGFSLLFAAYYYRNENFYDKAKKLLESELEEQILPDGAHFELSPMYHQIMLFRMLDCINLLKNNMWKDDNLLSLIIKKASIMLGWLEEITFSSGAIPLLNDSANFIAPSTMELISYATSLAVKSKTMLLSTSGYRKINKELYECVVDIGNIGPDYIPGHAHSDTFSFELYIKGLPFIVDTGTSTYETNAKRLEERGTKAHNTVMLNNTEQSEVWGGFRVASRAKVANLIEKIDYISATHDGYMKKFDTLHQREYSFKDKRIKIVDNLHTNQEHHKAIARIHFAPDIHPVVHEGLVLCDEIEIYTSSSNIDITDYIYAPEFNKGINAKMLEITFTNILELEIKI